MTGSGQAIIVEAPLAKGKITAVLGIGGVQLIAAI